MNPAATSAPDALRFGRFELQPGQRRLLVDGRPAALGGRSIDLLITLASRPDRLLTKSELLDLVWPGLVVEESNLHVQMSGLRKVLGGDVIATVPGRGYRFTAAVERPGAAPGEPAAPVLPPPDVLHPGAVGRLFGRGHDAATLDQWLQTPGCITIVGAAGVGKTRLAQALAARRSGRRVWVELAPLADDSQLVGAIARALGATLRDGDPLPQLLQALGPQPVLLTLDNAEHLVQPVAELVAGLQRGGQAGLRLLVTSQLPLAIDGERVYRLTPLSTDDLGADDGGDGALALLLDRIAAVDHRFQLRPGMLPVLRDICEQLDGLPLAVEMAAARVPLLGPAGVRDELAQRFTLLTTGHRAAAARHRSLHAALDWSYRLLGAEEQQLFRALGVFPGGFTLGLCTALCAAPSDPPTRDDAMARWQVIDRLGVLVDRSLVTAGPEDPPRYRLLETLRAYALEQATEAGETTALRLRHAQVVTDLFDGHLPGDAERTALLVAEFDNAREAIAWARQHAPELAVRIAARAAQASTFSPWFAEAAGWVWSLEALMQAPEADHSIGLATRALWWSELARTSLVRMKPRPAAALRAVELARELGDVAQLHGACVARVRSLREPGPELDAACAELLALTEAHPDLSLRAQMMTQGALAVAATTADDLPAIFATRSAEQALARRAGLHAAAQASETNLIFVLYALHRPDEALQRSRALMDELDDANGNLPYAWIGLMYGLLALGRLDEAQGLIGAAMDACRRFDQPLMTPYAAALAARRQRAREAALLSAHAREAYRRHAMVVLDPADVLLAEAEAFASAAFERDALARLFDDGRALDDDAARVLAVG